MRDCLVEHGYPVVAVESSQQAFREITSGDFALVLYDSLMRGFSVETFYQAVGRVDPGLCERFVFMADDRADEATRRFIRNSNRFVLRKPFQEKDLLDAITVAELCGAYQSAFDASQVEPEGQDIPDSPSALPRARSVAFTILATIRFGTEAKAESEEGA
jgi:CheY-like chemotaxis protein